MTSVLSRGTAIPPVLLDLEQLIIGYPGQRRAGGGTRLASTIPTNLSLPLTARVRGGEFICLLGPNGAGKSTLLRTLAGAQPALSGSIRIGGAELGALDRRELARRVAVVLTDPVHAWSLTGYELAALGRLPYLPWTGRMGHSDRVAVQRSLAHANAIQLAARPVHELSDGERQRILLARALAQATPLLVLDEITAFLDLPHRLEVMRLLGELVQKGDRTVLLSTHDLESAIRTADRIWLLPGDGSLRDGAPEDLILSGDIHRAFARFGVRFDAESGHFDWEVTWRGCVELHGEGLMRKWTARALARLGIGLNEGGREARHNVASGQLGTIRCPDSKGRATWELEHSGQVERFSTLLQLTRFLRDPASPS